MKPNSQEKLGHAGLTHANRPSSKPGAVHKTLWDEINNPKRPDGRAGLH